MTKLSAVISACFVLASCTQEIDLTDCERLSGESIVQMFEDVTDNAVVQDANDGRAVNSWYRDGRFTSDWSTRDDSGTVTGTWQVEGDLRCVTIESGLPEAVGNQKCSPLYLCGENVVSVNADGSIHGVHRLSPLQPDP